MKDFALNVNGDIVFGILEDEYNDFELNFLSSNANSFIFNIYIENYNDSNFLNDLIPQFVYNFSIKKIDHNKEISTTESDEDYYEQQIKIRLNTCLNSLLENENIGSKLILYNHKIINEKTSNEINKKEPFAEIKNAVKEALNDILPNAQINVSKINTIYLDYSNSLLITIKNNNYIYYYYL